jgi:hypothetical protein
MSEQSEFRRRYRYVIETDTEGSGASRAAVEEEVDAYWTFSPEIETERMRASYWEVTAYEGFGEAFTHENSREWLATPINGALEPEWLTDTDVKVIHE